MEEPTAVAPDGPPTTTTVASTNVAVVPKISPSVTSSSNADNQDPTPLEFDPSLSEDERRFYVKAYPTIDLVRERRVHCTTCKVHIGTAPTQESNIKMHPELRVTHCNKCHDFYNSGEFSKGEDGSELYCRWCGQGGEVYCCSNCAYVFCKSCIVKNLSRGVVSDIEQNENWSCFSCAPKILWPLRAQHWALINYIEKQKKNIQSMNLPDQEMRQLMSKDLSTCCRLAKAKCGNMSDSLESLDSATSRRSLNSAGSAKKAPKSHGGSASQSPSAKRAKPNDEVVCTPDLMSMLEPDCQITMSPKPRSVQSPATAAPRVMSLQAGGGGGYPQSSTPKNSAPPPLVLRNTGIQMRPVAPIVRRTVIGPRPAPNAGIGSPAAPVYHTINGYRIDLNSAAQQETFRLPNGKLIQVKRQGTQNPTPSSPTTVNNWPQQRQVTPSMHSRPAQIAQSTSKQYQAHITLQPQSSGHHLPQQHPQMIRYHNTMVGHTTVTPMNHNGGGGAQIHVINGGAASNPNPPMQQQQQQQAQLSGATVRPLMVRHVFPDTAIGQARTQLQDQVFNAMEICQHLTGKVQTLTNSNAYKQARNYLEVKELYIHLSYLLTYAIGRFKGLQDKCLGDMRQLGFVNDADSLENGQLAAGVDYVLYGQLDNVDLFNTGANSFHNQVYEYRKSLHANLEDGEDGPREPLPPLPPLGVGNAGDYNDNDDEDMDAKRDDSEVWPAEEESLLEPRDEEESLLEPRDEDDDNDDTEDFYMNSYDGDEDENKFNFSRQIFGNSSNAARRSTEDVMRREEESHAYDRKLTRLVEQYPSIWCTRHADYGNFDVTRKQWRTIASHFTRSENIKLRWKNIRKRYVRIERRMREGKRFNGYFDKATNFLSNRDFTQNNWRPVDRGEADGDIYERKHLDEVEQALHPNLNDDDVKNVRSEPYRRKPVNLVEIKPLDLKIINFVKCNPVLWRKTSDPTCNKIDEQTRKSLWMHLWKSMPSLNCEDIVDRWTHLYEMYKTFRLKTIKDEGMLANLELKYSKYLAKLYFLYKIDEEDLRNEYVTLEDCFNIDDEHLPDTKLQDMPDDKEFLLELVRTVRQYTPLWKKSRAVEYHDTVLRERLWGEIANKLKEFKRDVRFIKLRWQLAKYSYARLRSERRNLSNDLPLLKYCKNLPADEMTFLD